MTIHVWVPEYTSAVGGIQTFSRFVIRALRDYFPRVELEVFSKNDTSFPDPTNKFRYYFRPLGWWPTRLRTAAFAAELTHRAVPRTAQPDHYHACQLCACGPLDEIF